MIAQSTTIRAAGRCRQTNKPGFLDMRVSCLFSAVPNGGGLLAQLRLRFAAAIYGPLLLGRDSHRGGGLFAVQESEAQGTPPT